MTVGPGACANWVAKRTLQSHELPGIVPSCRQLAQVCAVSAATVQTWLHWQSPSNLHKYIVTLHHHVSSRLVRAVPSLAPVMAALPGCGRCIESGAAAQSTQTFCTASGTGGNPLEAAVGL